MSLAHGPLEGVVPDGDPEGRLEAGAPRAGKACEGGEPGDPASKPPASGPQPQSPRGARRSRCTVISGAQQIRTASPEAPAPGEV